MDSQQTRPQISCAQNPQSNSLSSTCLHQQIGFPLKLVCPACGSPEICCTGLDGEAQECQIDNATQKSPNTAPDAIRCSACNAKFSIENGFADLIVGYRFEDDSNDACLCYEESSNQYTVENYWIPQFSKLFATKNLSRKPRILALGCGIGVEVDLLNQKGFDCVGIDCGNRTRVWPKRVFNKHFLLANGMHLPFESGTFDIVFCGCVFPHVGVVGDSNRVQDDVDEIRGALAAEMARVLNQDGHIFVSSPNRKFPLDLFHGREAGSHKPRLNPPSSRFLLSKSDYQRLFERSGCRSFELQSVSGYWGFVGAGKTLKGTLLSLPIRLLFWLGTMPVLAALRDSMLSPWIVVKISKQNL